MGMGYLQVEATTAFDALPVPHANITVYSSQGQVLCRGTTDENGGTSAVGLYAPDAWHTLDPDDPGPFYAAYDVEIQAEGYQPVIIRGVQIFDTETSVLPVEMAPQTRSSLPQEISIPDNALLSQVAKSPEGIPQEGPAAAMQRFAREVVIPETITVHLGTPSSSARDVRVSFTDYIKNVASSEIYPTWPHAALEANIYCQITFALNRVYTEWYRSRGYSFDITSSTAYDQSYVDGRNIYANISQLVDTVFNTFVRRSGYAEPYFTQYCNGTTVTCNGLSQWGTVPLANQGLGASQILRSYYPNDIQLVSTDRIEGISESYPGAALRQGSTGEDVRRMQNYLNRIRINYPLIPAISTPNGVFGGDTAESVRVFQRTFSLTADGIIGKATWYRIIQIYNGVKKLAALESEGERIGIGTTPPTSVLREGSRGSDVVQLQFILNFLAEFYSDLPTVLENSSFDSRTKAAVVAFQRKFGLTADGIVGPGTWRRLYEVYHDIEQSVVVPPDPTPPGTTNPTYPGVLLRSGSRGESVRLMQQYLNQIFRFCPGYSRLAEDGIFGTMTTAAVTAFQGMAGLAQDGIIGPLTWNEIVSAFNQSI